MIFKRIGMGNKILDFATQILIMVIVLSVIILFVGIGFLVLIHVCFVWRVNRREVGVSGNMVHRSSSGKTSMPMSRKDLEKLSCYDYIAKDKGSRPVDCAVCLENFNMGDKCRLLPMCKHSFHVQCVDTWLLKTPICPICRTRAGSDGGSSVIG
ncbi:RING-H2 finger protein [Quillaja saponaria]|uniref:RING-type E3 ubiquitin transferase n=1 Tax=Quillaja saponaria TaxID=32244 RepID=A0AAD7Q4M4_QUISA|nr:RING-H2 finger protein [Quillaja saponaria]